MENADYSKLDIACGQNKQNGFLGIDIAAIPSVDIVHDLEVYPWPIPDNSVEEAHCSHYIEHTVNLMKFMNELYRILKPPKIDEFGKTLTGGKCVFIAPYYTSMRCWQDPTHTRAISEASFLYFNAEWRKHNKLDHYPITCDFDFTYGYNLAPDYANRSEDARIFAIKHYWNIVNDIIVTVTKK